MSVNYSIDWEGENTILTADDIDDYRDLFPFLKWAKHTLEEEKGFHDVSQRNTVFTIKLDEWYIQNLTPSDYVFDDDYSELDGDEDEFDDGYYDDDSDMRPLEEDVQLRKYASSLHKNWLSRKEFEHCKKIANVVPLVVSSEETRSSLVVFCNYDGKFYDPKSLIIQSGAWNSMIKLLKEYGMLSKQQADELLV